MDANDELKAVAGQIVKCTGCKLNTSRKLAVPGEGAADAEVMFIGEGPGFYENEQGRPFVGQAGRFLDELLQKAGCKRAQVFITNVVKCRPPGNRDPELDELQACAAYLDRQIEIINPLVIVTLGRFSMARYFPTARISSIHGKPAWVDGRFIVPMYHPAAALHQASLKSAVVEDFSRLAGFILEARKKRAAQQAAARPPEPEPEKPSDQATQLSLF